MPGAPPNGLVCNFRTGEVHLSGAFPDPGAATQALQGALRAIARFAAAYQDGVRSEASYRLWVAADEAPPDLARALG